MVQYRCMTQERKFSSIQAETGTQTGGDPLVDWMRRHRIPLTRERYLGLAYPTGLPEPWSAELEEQLPPEIRAGGRR
jgi:hypothetical protein